MFASLFLGDGTPCCCLSFLSISSSVLDAHNPPSQSSPVHGTRKCKTWPTNGKSNDKPLFGGGHVLMFLYADSNIVSPYSKYNGPNILATRRNKPVNGAGDTTTTCFF